MTRTAVKLFVGSNFFGAGNFGDDLALGGFLRVAARYPQVEITMFTAYDIASQRRRFPHVRWIHDDEQLCDEALRDADAWASIAGTPFQLDSGPWSLDHHERELRRCTALGKPMYWLGAGCESDAAAADPRSRALAAAARQIWTRDESSAERLRPFAATEALQCGADLAHLELGAAQTPAREGGLLGLVLAFERSEQFDLVELAAFLRARGAKCTRWILQEARVFAHTERWIFDALPDDVRAGLERAAVDYANASIGDYLRAFGAPEVTITSRYHGALVAAWHGSKVTVVARSGKLLGVARDLGVPFVENASSRSVLDRACEIAASVSRERLDDARRRADAMCEAFFAAVLRA